MFRFNTTQTKAEPKADPEIHVGPTCEPQYYFFIHVVCTKKDKHKAQSRPIKVRSEKGEEKKVESGGWIEICRCFARVVTSCKWGKYDAGIPQQGDTRGKLDENPL